MIRLETENLARVSVEIAVVPHLSVFAAAFDAFASRTPGLPPGVTESVRSAVSRSRLHAFQPMGDLTRSMLPDCVLPSPPDRRMTVEGYLESLRDLSADDVRASIAKEQPEHLSVQWLRIADKPKPWIDAFAVAMGQVATATKALLERARVVLDREIERVGTAVVTGVLPEALGCLSPRAALRGNAVIFDYPRPGHHEMGDRQLILAPMICGRSVLLSTFDPPDAVWIAYPARGLADLWTSPRESRPKGDPLELILGASRARLLRAVARPTQITMLASELVCAMSTATFHCSHLESMGLVTKIRRGREVWVRRTERAENLLHLMA